MTKSKPFQTLNIRKNCKFGKNNNYPVQFSFYYFNCTASLSMKTALKSFFETNICMSARRFKGLKSSFSI